jgi:LuxR family maltose regulon positive regulatory protein
VTTADDAELATAAVGVPEAVVVETKLTWPRVRAEHVPRTNLLAALDAAGACRLTLVAAPPGFGKTTLLAQWAAQTGAAVGWLSLDADDNDPARFVAHLVAALGQARPGIGERALAALRGPGGDLGEVVLPLLLNDLARLDTDTVLVLDDYHLVSSATVHEALAQLIARVPDSLRLVVATREDPPFPLGRLRAAGQLAEVRADQLRFSEAETSAFLVGALGLDLSASDVDQLQARTEGWPAALYLAALSLRGRTDKAALVERFAGDDRYIVDYLTTEVLARQPAELRTFLLRTSVLDRFCGRLCDAVAERSGSAALLEDLEHANLLLVPLDTRREWYRYHHLFGDLLRHELQATDPGRVPELHRRASTWCRDAGLVVEAADHAIAAGDVEAAAELVGAHYGFFVAEGQLATVLRWLDAIPPDVAARDWLLGFAAGVVSAHAGRLDDAERWLALAEQAPARERNGQHPDGSLAALAGYLALLRGDIGATVTNARRALATADAGDPVWALGPQMVLAPGLWWSGEPAEAGSVLEAMSRTAQTVAVPAAAVYALGIRAAIALDAEDERTAAALAGQAIELMLRCGLDEHPWAAMAHIVHGSLLGRRGELAAAAEEVERGVAFGERLRAWQLVAHACLALAEVRQRQHQPTAARRLLTRVRVLLEPLPDAGDGLARLERTEKALRLKADRGHGADAAPYWELSQRELEVLRLLPSRLSQREMAAQLYVSFNTVRTHTRVVFRKLGVASRAEAVSRARELGLL